MRAKEYLCRTEITGMNPEYRRMLLMSIRFGGPFQDSQEHKRMLAPDEGGTHPYPPDIHRDRLQGGEKKHLCRFFLNDCGCGSVAKR